MSLFLQVKDILKPEIVAEVVDIVKQRMDMEGSWGPYQYETLMLLIFFLHFHHFTDMRSVVLNLVGQFVTYARRFTRAKKYPIINWHAYVMCMWPPSSLLNLSVNAVCKSTQKLSPSHSCRQDGLCIHRQTTRYVISAEFYPSYLIFPSRLQ